MDFYFICFVFGKEMEKTERNKVMKVMKEGNVILV